MPLIFPNNADRTAAGRRKSCAGNAQLLRQFHTTSSATCSSSRQRLSFMPRVRTPMPSAVAVRTRWPLNCWSVLRITCFSISASGMPTSPPAAPAAGRLGAQPRLDRRSPDHAGFAFQDAGALDDVLQFAHVSRPVIFLQQAHRLRLDMPEWRLLTLACPREEMPRQFGNVILALAQRRQIDRHDVEAVEQILPEFSLGHRGLQIAVGGGDHADIHHLRQAAADALKTASPATRAAAWPAGWGDFADFIQQQRSAVGKLKAPAAQLVGAGECAFFMAEQFRFQQILRQRGAIHRQHRPLAPRRCLMNRPGHHFLAGAAFAADQDVALLLASSSILRERHPSPGCSRSAAAGRRFPSCCDMPGFPGAGGCAPGPVHQQLDLLTVERLLNVVVRAQLHRLDGRMHGGERRHQHDRHDRAAASWPRPAVRCRSSAASSGR
jgi:hypothetical protein